MVSERNKAMKLLWVILLFFALLLPLKNSIIWLFKV